MKDNKGDNKDFAIDTESVVDPNANIVNSGKANKTIGNTVFALFGIIRKRFGDADKSV